MFVSWHKNLGIDVYAPWWCHPLFLWVTVTFLFKILDVRIFSSSYLLLLCHVSMWACIPKDVAQFKMAAVVASHHSGLLAAGKRHGKDPVRGRYLLCQREAFRSHDIPTSVRAHWLCLRVSQLWPNGHILLATAYKQRIGKHARNHWWPRHFCSFCFSVKCL